MPPVERSSLLVRLAAAIGAAVLLVSCAHNPATGGNDVVLSSKKGEVEESRRYYDEITRFYGVYEDQAVQEYVNAVGQRALGSLGPRPDRPYLHGHVDRPDHGNAGGAGVCRTDAVGDPVWIP